MRSYPRRVISPGVPGGAPVEPLPNTPARGRPARLVLLALSVFLIGTVAPGSPAQIRGISSAASEPTVAPGVQVRRDVAIATHHAQFRAPVRVVHPVIVRVARPVRLQPWLPTGTGVWVHEWPKTMHGNAAAVVHRARAYGVSTLYVRTGTLKGGFNGGPVLRALLPATRRTNIKVVAWDFPTLANPVADARRLAAAARYRPPGRGAPRVAAVAPDIETGAEGAHSTQHRVAVYLHTLRHLLPHTPILATVPWPSENRRGRFPYGTVAHYANALMPMAYWYNRNPTAVTAYSVRWLKRYHRPVLPVGQGFDSHADASYLPHSHQNHEVTLFFRAALHNHAPALSLWSWQTAGKAQWRALAHYRNSFHPRVRKRAHKPAVHHAAHRPVRRSAPARKPRRVAPTHMGRAR
ncbi:MAG: hypothetical protein ACJ735_01630 [Actinomycetes bacterium]